MLTMVRPSVRLEPSERAGSAPEPVPVSEADVEISVRYCSPEALLMKIAILRSLEGDSEGLREAEARIRTEYQLAR